MCIGCDSASEMTRKDQSCTTTILLQSSKSIHSSRRFHATVVRTARSTQSSSRKRAGVVKTRGGIPMASTPLTCSSCQSSPTLPASKSVISWPRITESHDRRNGLHKHPRLSTSARLSHQGRASCRAMCSVDGSRTPSQFLSPTAPAREAGCPNALRSDMRICRITYADYSAYVMPLFSCGTGDSSIRSMSSQQRACFDKLCMCPTAKRSSLHALARGLAAPVDPGSKGAKCV